MRFLITLAGILTLAATLAAQTAGVFIPAPPAVTVPELKQYLNLTDGQITSLQNIQQQQQQAVQQVSSQLQEKYTTLQNLLQAPNPNPNTIGQTMIDIQNLQKQLTPSTEPYHTQALAILTQAQTALLANLNTALQLQTPAYEAISVNLLIAPSSSIGIVTPVIKAATSAPLAGKQ